MKAVPTTSMARAEAAPRQPKIVGGKQRRVGIRVNLFVEPSSPELFEALRTLPPRKRAERIRQLAMSALTGAAAAPAAPPTTPPPGEPARKPSRLEIELGDRLSRITI